jgi:ribonuclease HI
MFDSEQGAVPEWAAVCRACEASLAGDPAGWVALAGCPAVEIYTDGSAPLRNPGGPAGFAAAIVGFAAPVPAGTFDRPAPDARLDLGGYIAARRTEPATSNNRAEIAGVLAALRALAHLAAAGGAPPEITVWSDSSYVVNCGTGLWQRKKNTDLWPIYDQLAAQVAAWAPHWALAWVKGHARNPYNEAADEVATRAAFDFDAAQYQRYRAAQEATGQEMPGAAALAATVPAPAVSDASAPGAARPQSDAPGAPDYILILQTRLSGQGYPGGMGEYHIRARDGRTRTGQVTHLQAATADEAEYRTLIAALTDLAGRITAAGRDPAAYTLAIYSRQELVVKQLTGAYRVKAPALQPLYTEARTVLARFGVAGLIWKPASEWKALFPGA